MIERDLLFIFIKAVVSIVAITLCEYKRNRPLYYKREVLLASLVIAVLPLGIHVVMYLATAYMLRLYPYGAVRAWMWPAELYRSIVKGVTNTYPHRKY